MVRCVEVGGIDTLCFGASLLDCKLGGLMSLVNRLSASNVVLVVIVNSGIG